jgi:hypothetical protein
MYRDNYKCVASGADPMLKSLVLISLGTWLNFLDNCFKAGDMYNHLRLGSIHLRIKFSSLYEVIFENKIENRDNNFIWM